MLARYSKQQIGPFSYQQGRLQNLCYLLFWASFEQAPDPPKMPNALKPRQTIGFRTAILQLVLGALLFSVGTIGIVGYVSSARTLEEMRQQHFSLVARLSEHGVIGQTGVSR